MNPEERMQAAIHAYGVALRELNQASALADRQYLAMKASRTAWQQASGTAELALHEVIKAASALFGEEDRVTKRLEWSNPAIISSASVDPEKYEKVLRP